MDEVKRLLIEGEELEKKLKEIRAFLRYFSKLFDLHIDLTNWRVIDESY